MSTLWTCYYFESKHGVNLDTLLEYVHVMDMLFRQ